MKARKTDLVALGFLIAALVLFGMFQGLPYMSYFSVSSSGDSVWTVIRGYDLWALIWQRLMRPVVIDQQSWVTIMGVLLATLVSCLSPFLINVLAGSRALWWAMIIVAAMMVCGLTGVLGWDYLKDLEIFNEDAARGPGFLCLILYPIPNFVGLLCIRKRFDGMDRFSENTEAGVMKAR